MAWRGSISRTLMSTARSSPFRSSPPPLPRLRPPSLVSPRLHSPRHSFINPRYFSFHFPLFYFLIYLSSFLMLFFLLFFLIFWCVYLGIWAKLDALNCCYQCLLELHSLRGLMLIFGLFASWLTVPSAVLVKIANSQFSLLWVLPWWTSTLPAYVLFNLSYYDLLSANEFSITLIIQLMSELRI